MPKSKPRDRSRKKVRPKPIKWRGDGGTVPARPRPVVEFPRPDSSSKLELTLVSGFPQDHQESLKSRPLLGGPSVYNVTYYLSVPGLETYRKSVDLAKLDQTGDSLLQFRKDEIMVVKSSDDNSESQIHFLSNNSGRLSKATLRVSATSFDEAERYAHERVAMMLSYWSYLFDIAIEASSYQIIEEETGTRKYSVGLVGRVKAFSNDAPFSVSPEYRRILAAYREGMNSSNQFYATLSFYKVIEGVLSLRKKKQRTAKRKGDLFDSSEVFPTSINDLPVEKYGGYENQAASISFSSYLGKPFEDVRADLKDRIRNAVAHLGDFEKVLDIDRFDDVVICARAVPVLKYMAKILLDNDLALRDA